MSLVELSMVVLLTIMAGIETPAACEDTPCASDDDCTAVAPDLCHPGLCDVEAGTCRCDKTPNCCLGSAECQDLNPCNADYCQDHQCRHSAYNIDPPCCWADPVMDPDTGLPWASNEARQMVADANCRTNPCKIGSTCNLATNLCRMEYTPGCCITVEDCEDDDPCTQEECIDNVCQYPLLHAGCCTTDDDCDDGVSCTLDRCISKFCLHWFGCQDAGANSPDVVEPVPDTPPMADATFDETNEITDADAFSDAVDSPPDRPEEDSLLDSSAVVDHDGTPSDRDSPDSEAPLTDPVAGSDNEIVPQDAVELPERPESTRGGCSMSGPVELSPWLLMIVLWLVARRRRPPICP